MLASGAKGEKRVCPPVSNLMLTAVFLFLRQFSAAGEETGLARASGLSFFIFTEMLASGAKGEKRVCPPVSNLCSPQVFILSGNALLR